MIKRFFSQSWLYYKGQYALAGFGEVTLYQIINPIITLVYFCLLAAYSFQTSDLSHWVIGNSLLLCNSVCIFSLGQTFTSERYNGRLKSIICAPMSSFSTILQKSFFPIIVAITQVVMGVVFGSLIFGINFANVNLLLFSLVILSAIISAVGFGVFLSSFGLLSDSMHMLLNVSASVLAIFSGVNFPVNQLSPAVRWISQIIPLTHSMQAADMLFSSFDAGQFVYLLCYELVLGIAYIIICFLIFKIVEKLSIKKGTLETF